MGSQKQSIVDVSEIQSHMPDIMTQATRRLKNQGLEIVWSGTAFICGKQIRHYPAFSRNGTTIPVHSFVFVTAEGERDYVGYLIDLYADKRGNKKANVRCFRHSRELNDVKYELEFDPREIFITHHDQAISVKCIKGFAIVLTPTHYEKCLAVVSLNLSTQVHVCSRLMVDNKVKPFSLSTLHGYNYQPILACIDWPHSIFETQIDNSRVKNSNPGKQTEEIEPPSKKLKSKFTNRGQGSSIDLVKSETPIHAPGQRIEVLRQDSGMRGCWFRCKVLKASLKCLKIQYVDVLDVEDSTNLQECISTCQVAAADKLGMRSSGRPTIRPYPPKGDSSVEDPRSYAIGTAVDAWWCDGWWEGFVVGQSGTQALQVYSPGEEQTLTVEIKDLRISRDWVGDKWIDVVANKDILTCISSSAKPNKLEAVDKNMAVADLLNPLRISDKDY